MGYACPVCGVEQADGVHLANHLAVTASLGRADHEGWLETHAPDWGDCGPEELAERIVPHVPEVDVDVETGHRDTPPRQPSLEGHLAEGARRPGRGASSAVVDDVLAEARELTRQMAGDGESERGRDDSETVGSDSETGDANEGNADATDANAADADAIDANTDDADTTAVDGDDQDPSAPEENG